MNFRNPVPICGVALLLSSCAPQHPKDMRQIDSLRVQAEDLVKTQSRMGYEGWVYGKESLQDSLYKANASLFSLDNITLLQRAEKEENDPLQKKRLQYFRRLLISEFIAMAVAPLTDRANNIEATATVSCNGKLIPYREIPVLLANERDQAQRGALYSAADPVLDTLNAVLLRIEQDTRRLTKNLGYASFNAAAEDLKGFPLERLKPVTELILAETDSLYVSLLKEQLQKQVALEIEHFYRYDIDRLFRSDRFDQYFPPSSMLEILKTTYEGLGVNVDVQKNLTIDAERRPEKRPRAVCYSIDVPNDIRLSIKPIGGFDDYAALFHEMGHAEHYATTTEHSFEFRYIGEPTVTETYAFLSEYLLASPAWLRLHSRMPTPLLKEFVRFQAFIRLLYVRRYCAKFLYEFQLHAEVRSPQSLYASIMSSSLHCKRVPSDEYRYLTDIDPNYYSASYLRAWFLEAQLNARLTQEFGTNWFEYPRAGEYVQSLWSKGDRLNGDELVQQLGYDSIDPSDWLAEIKSMILFSTR